MRARRPPLGVQQLQVLLGVTVIEWVVNRIRAMTGRELNFISGSARSHRRRTERQSSPPASASTGCSGSALGADRGRPEFSASHRWTYASRRGESATKELDKLELSASRQRTW